MYTSVNILTLFRLSTLIQSEVFLMDINDIYILNNNKRKYFNQS